MLVLFPALLLRQTGDENHVDGAAISLEAGLRLREGNTFVTESGRLERRTRERIFPVPRTGDTTVIAAYGVHALEVEREGCLQR